MDFQSEKSFGKLRLRAFQPYHQTLCILKHVEDNLRTKGSFDVVTRSLKDILVSNVLRFSKVFRKLFLVIHSNLLHYSVP